MSHNSTGITNGLSIQTTSATLPVIIRQHVTVDTVVRQRILVR